MTSFRAAEATSGDWRSAVRACIEQLDGMAPGANLGFVYASDPLSEVLDLIVTELQRATGIRDWAGTGGSGVCASGREHVGEGALVALAGALPEDSFRLFDRVREDAGGLDPAVAAWARASRGGFGIVHGDPRQARVPETIARLADDHDLFLAGGLSSAAAGAIQIAGHPTEGGLSGVLLGPDVPVVTALSQGCAPIGPAHTVSAIRGPWVVELDGRPALEVLKAEAGEVLARQLGRIGGFIHVALPVEGSDRADYVVRNLISIDAHTGSLAVGAPLGRGARLMFVKRDGVAAQADLRRMLTDLRARTDGRPIRGALYHTCIARGPHMFGPDSAEQRMIAEALGPVPLIGLFASGEVFHNRLYAYTGVLTVFL